VPSPPFDHAVTLAIFTAAYVALGLGRVPGLRVDRTGVAIIAAAAILATHWYAIDPILSVLVAVLILRSAWINIDLIWTVALALTGALLLLLS